MKKTRSTKQALIMSALSLLLCMSMLIGTTFAWFTDSVESLNNKIVAGNLDVELEYYNGTAWEAVDTDTNVFEENTLWEPGHTEVVYLKVSNLGTLALKYALNINIVKETYSINVAGEELKLSDYIMVDVIEGVTTPFASREAALKAAADDTSFTADTLKSVNADKVSKLYPVGDTTGVSEEYVALVVYMPYTVGNEANYRTGEVVPEIHLGINLMATQLTYENDSFDNKYDETAKVDGVPMASVTNMAVMPVVTTTKATYTLNTAYIFDATEDFDAAALNAHRYWHADFVASFDKDVDGADVGLAGQYDAFSTDWLAFELDGLQIKANTPVRMLINEEIGTNFPINYEELCGVVKSFKCGAFAVDPAAMAGVTMTVELRIYETTVDPSLGTGDKNVETGKYITIGTYSYTFPNPVINTPLVGDSTGTGYEGDLFEEGATDFFVVQRKDLNGNATIALKRTYKTVVLEDVVANVNGDLITAEADNTIVLHNCDITLPEGAKLIVGDGAVIGQVMIHNVTVNGVLLTQTSAAQYLEGVNWYQVW